MPQNDRPGYLKTSINRRAVVVGGSRLVYATPMVAASFRLSELRARAEESVSDTQLIAAAGLYPPMIGSVSYSAPSWVLITGRNLSDASVTFSTDQGPVSGGFIQANSDAQIVVSIADGLTILSTTVETLDGIAIFDQTTPPPQKPEPPVEIHAAEIEDGPLVEPDLAERTQEEAAPEAPAEQPVEAPAEDLPIEQEQAAVVEQPVVEEPPIVAPVAPPVEEPVQEPAAEAAPPPAEPVQEPAPVEQAPVQEPPVASIDIGVGVAVREPGATMYDAPSWSGGVVMELSAGNHLVIVGQRQAVDGTTWWPVQHFDSGLTGFVAEPSLALQT